MSYMTDKLNAEKGVCLFVLNKGLVEIDKKGQRGKLNTFLAKFLREHNLEVEKYNPRYRGLYDALNVNCQTVQANWEKFHVWVNQKVKEKDTLTVG